MKLLEGDSLNICESWHCERCNDDLRANCKVSHFFKIFGKKHTLRIIQLLLTNEKMRFNEIQSHLNLNSKTLSLRLKLLESNNIIDRIYIQDIPPRVNYYMSKKGMDIVHILNSISKYF